MCQKKFTVFFHFSDKDSSYHFQQLDLKSNFENKEAAVEYINKLPQTLLSKGFATASVDSVFYDSLKAIVTIYLGEKYKWGKIITDSIPKNVLENIGWNEKEFSNKEIIFSHLQNQQQKIIEYYENNGYPFAEVFLKNIDIKNDLVTASLEIAKGPLYHIDSIRIYGKVKIKKSFLQKYLDISNGSVYNNQKMQQISKLIQQLPFLQEQQGWNVTMLGTGATLNLYLEPKRSSQINVLIGFVPANTISRKSQITADVHLDLQNSFGSGESILFNWQQLQPQSPRLNLGYSLPNIFNSNFGIDLSFDLLKRDSSYLQLNGILGLKYNISSSNTFKIFYENEQNYLLSGGIDTNQIIYTKRLPANIDVSSGNIGIGYHFDNTNYRLNPRKGNEFDITATAGIKKTSKNNNIINLKDPSNPSFDFNSLYDSIKPKTYRFKIVAEGAHYFPLGKASTFKTAASIGLLQSPQNFLNELFRIGGYQILRGFDEESIYANKYLVLTGQYRYLVGINSYFFGFSDAGFTKTNFNTTNYSNSFISGGIGLEFETKFGLLNLSYAVGKRNDVPFDIRNSSKIHFGYINYF
ncbi:MAG TPA: BamA/TamA family outer membrane protein [Hanamia sp.]|nr:BamA/TamA family outer membrane protein [Hanamia sp.]